MRCVIGALAMILWILAGCGSRRAFEVAPPCAILVVESVNQPGRKFMGQGIWIEDRLLTVAHVFTVPRADDPPRSFLLNGRWTDVLGYKSGNLDTIRRAYTHEVPPDPRDLTEDWMGLHVSAHAGVRGRMRIGAGTVRPGETLYAVGFEPEDPYGDLLVIPLVVQEQSVLIGRAAQSLPDRVITVKSPRRRELTRWSGAFVGRYDARRREWEYVGQLVAALRNDNDRVVGHAVVRPPPESLEWLMKGVANHGDGRENAGDRDPR